MKKTSLLALLLALGLGVDSASGQRRIAVGSNLDLPFGEPFTAEGIVSSVGANVDCWGVSIGSRRYVVDIMPSHLQRPALRVTVTGRLQDNRMGNCRPSLLIDQIEVAEGPQLRVAVFERLVDAQECLEKNDYRCALDILDDIQERYDLNPYEEAQLLSFYGTLHYQRNDNEQAIDNFTEILEFGDIASRMLPDAWWMLAILYFREARYDEALTAIDQACARGRCDRLADLRERIVFRIEGRPSIESSDELATIVDEITGSVNSEYSCRLNIESQIFDELTGVSWVEVTVAGTDCADAVSYAKRHGDAMRILFLLKPQRQNPSWPEQPPRNFDLINDLP